MASNREGDVCEYRGCAVFYGVEEDALVLKVRWLGGRFREMTALGWKGDVYERSRLCDGFRDQAGPLGLDVQLDGPRMLIIVAEDQEGDS